jgi:heme exporter protein A
MWLRGRNGRGKTTLLRLLAGLSTPAQGDILVLGQSLKGAPVSLRSAVGYLAHANALKDDLTAAEALSFVGALAGYTPSPAEVVDALKRLGIASRAGAPVRTLSQGQRRRVALARLALPRGPRVWLLDEPFDALDDRGVEVLNGLLADHAASGGAVLLTSHQALSLRHPEPQVLNLDDYSVLA